MGWNPGFTGQVSSAAISGILFPYAALVKQIKGE